VQHATGKMKHNNGAATLGRVDLGVSVYAHGTVIHTRHGHPVIPCD
jgi:hypothetical protein